MPTWLPWCTFEVSINKLNGPGAANHRGIKMKIKTIDIQSLEWFDKSAGNSYCASLVTVNFGMKNEKTFKVPFHYGYNEQYQYEAMKVLAANGVIKNYDNIAPWRYCRENDIILRASKKENCKKSELLNIGE